MWNLSLVRCHMLAHQKPSFHHSLLSGFDPVGAEPAPTDEGPSKPMSPGAAAATAGNANATNAMRKARQRTPPVGGAKRLHPRPGPHSGI